MTELWAALVVFTLFHVLPSTQLRGFGIDRLGRSGFMALYSFLSLVLFAWLFVAFFRADVAVWWVTPSWLRTISAGIMLFAFVLLAASLLHRPPVLLTGETVLARDDSVSGVLRITRHPFLWALVLWSFVHTFNNPDPAGLALFGYFLLLALVGTLPIDRRRARLLGEVRWKALADQTSNLPFAAIVAGRQSLKPALAEIGWLPLALAGIAWGLVLHFHAALFGMPIFF